MMKNSIVALVVSLTVVFTASSEEAQEPSGTTGRTLACPIAVEWQGTPPDKLMSDRESIDQLMQDWSKAVLEADLETIVSLVTDDCEFWTHGAAPLVGREALSGAFGPFLAKYTMRQEFDCQELVVSGDLAFMSGTEVNHLTPAEGGETIVRRQRAFSILRRSPDGSWLFARGMTNLPPES